MLRDSLFVAKSNLSTTKPEFKRLAASSQDYSDMLQLLGQMYADSGLALLTLKRLTICSENLQFVPENLEAKISEKKFLSAVQVLNEALRITKQPEIENIAALADIKAYVASQEMVWTLTASVCKF